MSKCDCEVVRNFALEIEKSMHNLCPTDRANKVVIFVILFQPNFYPFLSCNLEKVDLFVLHMDFNLRYLHG